MGEQFALDLVKLEKDHLVVDDGANNVDVSAASKIPECRCSMASPNGTIQGSSCDTWNKNDVWCGKDGQFRLEPWCTKPWCYINDPEEKCPSRRKSENFEGWTWT